MDMNLTTSDVNTDFLGKYARLINLTLSCTGVVTNLILFMLLLVLGRRHCTTYFLLIMMTICDFLYCAVYASILLTIDQYINIINHQIICPLSFFLTPFTFTGSTLLLLTCLLHFITNYVRRYDTIIGQITGRLSVAFIFAFIIIRSVLGTTSIELMPDPVLSHVQHCTVDMNTPELVAKVQTINHIFSEVTDILIYIGWIIIILIYVIYLIQWKNSPTRTHRKFSPFVPLFILKKYGLEPSINTNQGKLPNKQRHYDVSLIILSVSLLSIICYFPVMLNKFNTMNLIYRAKTFLNDRHIFLLQIIQQTAHLFCLTIRFLPYFIFDKRIRSLRH